ncbi:MAG: hypothetical protein AMXMBFR47_06780 [Planctomycetota bacterium]
MSHERNHSSLLLGICLAALLTAGCTRESVRIAIESQRRADDVQQAVFDRQRDGLRMLLFRDLIARLEYTGGTRLTDDQLIELNRVWNERDLIEFWGVQFERAKALRMAGVDAKLFSDQSIVDLLARRLVTGAGRATEALAAAAGAAAANRAVESGDSTDAAQGVAPRSNSVPKQKETDHVD